MKYQSNLKHIGEKEMKRSFLNLLIFVLLVTAFFTFALTVGSSANMHANQTVYIEEDPDKPEPPEPPEHTLGIYVHEDPNEPPESPEHTFAT